MTFSENLKKFFSNTARAAVKKSGEVLETAKIKYSEFDLNSDIDRMYTELGKVMYNGYKNDSDVSEEIQTLCEKVDEKMIKLLELKK